MEYSQTPDGQIQSDLAGRLGQLLLQYESLRINLPIEKQFEATLTLSLLQTILTQCQELLRKKRDPAKAPRGLEELVWLADRELEARPSLLGLDSSCVNEVWPSSKPLKYRDIIECLRNALSHPLPQTSEGLPRTGYTALSANNGAVQSFKFTQSPWVDTDGNLERRCRAKSGTNAETISEAERVVKFIQGWTGTRGITGVTLGEDSNGLLIPTLNGMPFVPVMRIELNVGQLRVMTLSLSDYLSEPSRQRAALEMRVKV